MVDDHTKANDQLKELASKENIPIPDALDSKHQAH
jgi:predicted outer membrane protein